MFNKNVSFSTSHKKTLSYRLSDFTSFRHYKDLIKNLPSAFIYKPILMKIYMNANIVNIYWCMTSEVIQGHIWSSFYLKIHFFFDILFVWYLLSDILWTTFCPCFFCILILKLRSAFVYLTYLPATLLYFIDVSQNIWKYAIIFATISISSKDKLLKRMINKVCHILVFFFFVYFQMFKLRIGETKTSWIH